MAAVVRAGRFGLCRNWKYQNAGAMFGRTLTTSKKNEETATINEKIASHSISDEAIASAAQKVFWPRLLCKDIFLVLVLILVVAVSLGILGLSLFKNIYMYISDSLVLPASSHMNQIESRC